MCSSRANDYVQNSINLLFKTWICIKLLHTHIQYVLNLQSIEKINGSLERNDFKKFAFQASFKM